MFVRAVSPEEGRRLQKITKTSRQPVRVRRAIVVMASAQQQPVPAIARLMQVSEAYVRQVIHDFNERGFEALDPKWTLLANSGRGQWGWHARCRYWWVGVGWRSGCRCVRPAWMSFR